METNSSKEAYLQLCAERNDISLFMQPWWLDAVCAGHEWQALMSYDSDGEVIAACVYMIKKCLKMKYATLPPLCYDSCVWLRDTAADNEDTLKQITADWEQHLSNEKIAYFKTLFDTESKLPKLMEQQQYRRRLRPAYKVQHLNDLDNMLANYSKSAKKELQQALTLQADRDIEPENFYQIYESQFTAKGKEALYSREFFLVLYKKSQRLEQSQLLAIRNQAGDIKAAALLIWDNNCMYALMPYLAEDAQTSGAQALLYWEAQKFASQKVSKFDFCTIWKRHKASYARQYGGKVANTQQVSRVFNKWFWVVLPFVS